MDDEEEKKAKIVNLIKTAAKPAKPRRKPVPVGPGTVIAVSKSGQAQAAGRDIHNHINEKKVVRPTVVRGPGFISSAGARKIQQRIDALVEIGVAAGGEAKRLYARWYKQLKDYFDVPSYLEIPAHQEQHAIDWLTQQKALQRPKIRRAANDLWRGELYRGIWSRARQLGMSKADVYHLAFEKFGVRVISLKQLGERNLKALHSTIFGK